MVDTNLFILYLLIFRLAIIAVGVICIILGYRLFSKGLSKSPTEVTASVKKEIAFTLKTTAPGTVFALFGIVVISVMLATGSPELAYNKVDGSSTGKETLKLKGSSEDITQMVTVADYLIKGGKKEEAINVYKEILFLAVKPLNNLAWLYQQQGKVTEALPLAQVAVQISPEDATNLSTLAEILIKKREYPEAQKLLEKAAEIAPDNYASRLEQFKEWILKGNTR